MCIRDRDIFRIIEDINRTGTTILLVEQNANMALRIASRAYVLETGSVMSVSYTHLDVYKRQTWP